MKKIAHLLACLCVVVVPALAVAVPATAGESPFAQAWSKYVSGAFADAELVVDTQLQTIKDDTLMLANFYYLKGLIQSRTDDQLQDALTHFEFAYQLYTENASTYGIYVVSLAMAGVYIDQGLAGAAEDALQQNIEIGARHGFPLTYPYHLLARVAFVEGDYAAAMNYGFMSYQHLTSEDPGARADALLTLGFYRMLNGYVDNGHALTLEGQAALAGSGDQNKYFYSLLNMVLYLRCRGMDASAQLAMIERRAAEDGDAHLRSLAAFVAQYDCTQTAQLESDPPPPPPDPPIPPP